jgi:parallel beta-helix repeat protein
MLRFARLAAFALMLLAAAATIGQVQAKAPGAIIQVFPGPKAIKKALKQSSPGDTLNIHTGTYIEAVRVKKPNMTLKAAGDGPVIVDAQCNSVTTINVEANGVTIQGLDVRGASYYGINFEHIVTGVARRNTLTNTCAGADYGVNVFDGGIIQVIGNTGSGYEDAVIYIGGIVDTGSGTLTVKKNKASGSLRGIIVEDSASVEIDVLRNKVFDNTEVGILLHNVDSIRVANNTVTDNTTSGIHLDGTSDFNIVLGNTVSGHTYDLNNEGANNCFNNNTYTTSNGPINPCVR